MANKKRIVFFCGIMLLGLYGFSIDTFCGESLAELRKGQDIIAEIKKGNFYAVIEKEEDGGMRVKKKYRTREVKEALYQLWINPPEEFMTDGEGVPRVYLLRIMGDIHETRVIPTLMGAMGDKGIAMSFGRMGEDALRALLPELKKNENKIYAPDVIALNEMARKGDVGYVADENSRKEIKKYLLKAVDISDEIGQKYAVRGLGEFAVQGDTEAIKVIEELSKGKREAGQSRALSVKIEAVKVISKLKAKGIYKR